MSIAPTPALDTPTAKRRSFGAMVAHQLRYELRIFVRNRQSLFFTMALPVLFLVIFASVFGHSHVRVPGGLISTSVYYVPGIIALGVISRRATTRPPSASCLRPSGDSVLTKASRPLTSQLREHRAAARRLRSAGHSRHRQWQSSRPRSRHSDLRLGYRS